MAFLEIFWLEMEIFREFFGILGDLLKILRDFWDSWDMFRDSLGIL